VLCSVKVSGEKYTSPMNLVKIIFFGALCLIGYTNVVTTIYRISTGTDIIGRK
jgi:hypothetical protein